MTTPWTWVYFQRPGFTLYQEDDKILTATDQTIERAQALRDMAARRVPGLHTTRQATSTAPATAYNPSTCSPATTSLPAPSS